MKFVFPYQKLMNHRKLEEDIAQRDFFEAQRVFQEAQKVLETMGQELRGAFLERERVANHGGAVSSDLNTYEEYIRGQKIRIQRHSKTVEQLAQILEQKRMVLVEAVKAYKVLEKLKEKRMSAFKKEKRKLEVKQTDEIVTMRYHQGRDS